MSEKDHTGSQGLPSYHRRIPGIGLLVPGSLYWHAWCRFAAAALGGLYSDADTTHGEAIKRSSRAADELLLEAVSLREGKQP